MALVKFGSGGTEPLANIWNKGCVFADGPVRVGERAWAPRLGEGERDLLLCGLRCLGRA